MTVSIAKVTAGKQPYYESELEVTQEAYYLKERISQNQYVGQGAAAWGLNGQTIEAGNPVFGSLFRGEHPITGDPLIRGTKTERQYGQASYKAVRAYDLTFSPPKSVSIIEALSWTTGDTQAEKQVWDCHERAVKATLRYVDDKLLFTRTGAGGRQRERVHGTFALIHHNTSRPVSAERYPDPQLHTHALLFNAGVRSDGRTGAIDARPLFRSHHRLGDIYHRTLQQELQQTFGFCFHHVPLKKGWSFEIEGVPHNLIREFSQRRLAIEQVLQGNETPKQVRKEVLATRKAKPQTVDRAALLMAWQQTAERHQFDVRQFLHRPVKQEQPPRETERREVSLPLSEPTQRQAQPSQNLLKPLPSAQAARPVVPSRHSAAPSRPASSRQAMQRIRDRLAVQPELPPVEQDKRDIPLSPQRDEVTAQRQARPTHQPAASAPFGAVSRRLIHPPRPIARDRSSSARKVKRLHRKFLWLYATGRINRRTYLRVVEGRGLPASRWGIDFAYATYRISQAQRLHLYHKYGYGLPKGTPTSPVGINLAYATHQITAGQRLYLLHRRQKPRERLTLQHKPEMRQALKQRIQLSNPQHLPADRPARPSILKQIATVRSPTSSVQSQPPVKQRPHR